MDATKNSILLNRAFLMTNAWHTGGDGESRPTSNLKETFTGESTSPVFPMKSS